MDADLKAYLDSMKSELKGSVNSAVTDLQQRIRDNADVSLKAHEATRQQVSVLGSMVKTLWQEVKGSDPPPPADFDPRTNPRIGKPMDEKLSEHDLSIAGMQGQVIAIDSKVNNVQTDLTKLHELVDTRFGIVEQQNARQLQAIGVKPAEDARTLGERFVDFVVWCIREREGQKFVATTFAAITGLITAVGTTYAIMTGRMPLPTSPAPTVQQPYEAPSAPAPRLPAPGTSAHP